MQKIKFGDEGCLSRFSVDIERETFQHHSIARQAGLWPRHPDELSAALPAPGEGTVMGVVSRARVQDSGIGWGRSLVTAATLGLAALALQGAAAAQSPGLGVDYQSQGFSVPLTVTVDPALASPPTIDSYYLLTWDSASSEDDKIRFFVPERVRPPGGDFTSPPPDYLSYLLGQADAGAVLSDRSETTVDGHPATLVTAEAPSPLDDSIGCAPLEEGPACFGIGPPYTLRMAVIDLGDAGTLVTWARTLAATPNETFFAQFERMLGTVRFDADRSPGSTPYAAPSLVTGQATPIDGTYTTSFTRDELAASPLLYDQTEINDGNWGDWTFMFDRGIFTEELKNPTIDFSADGTYEVDGDLVIIVVDQGGGPETFGLRWALEGDALTFTRDPDQVGPTPFLVKTWTRVP